MYCVSVLTLFPTLFPGPLGASLMGKALENNKWGLTVVPLRDFALDRHQTVDDTAFGGGAGMVMRPDIVDAALTYHTQRHPMTRLIYLSPKGRLLTQSLVKELAYQNTDLTLLCGRYEGVDQRVLDQWKIEEISIGDYILTGGEMAAYVLIDAVLRLIPGVLGNQASLHEESLENHLLEYPHYTRPQNWNGHLVPDVLLSGNHGKIKGWRQEQSEHLTKERRPDLWQAYIKERENESSTAD